jgi:hypothetical protein
MNDFKPHTKWNILLLALCFLLSACGAGSSGHVAAAPSHHATQEHAQTPAFRMGDTLQQVEGALHVLHPLVRVNPGGPKIWYSWYYFFRDPQDTVGGTPQARFTLQTDGAGSQSRVIKVMYHLWQSEQARGAQVTFAQCDIFGPRDVRPIRADAVVGAGEYFNFYSPSLARDIAPDAWRTGNPPDGLKPGNIFLHPILDGSYKNIIGCMWSLGTD